SCPELAQPSNFVLSLSKHAWSLWPALRQAQGEAVVASTVTRQRESRLSLVGISEAADIAYEGHRPGAGRGRHFGGKTKSASRTAQYRSHPACSLLVRPSLLGSHCRRCGIRAWLDPR